MPAERDAQQNRLVVHTVDQRAPFAALLMSRKDELLRGLVAIEGSRDRWRKIAYFFAAIIFAQAIFRAVSR